MVKVFDNCTSEVREINNMTVREYCESAYAANDERKYAVCDFAYFAFPTHANETFLGAMPFFSPAEWDGRQETEQITFIFMDEKRVILFI